MRHFYDKFIMRALAGFSIRNKWGRKKLLISDLQKN